MDDVQKCKVHLQAKFIYVRMCSYVFLSDEFLLTRLNIND